MTVDELINKIDTDLLELESRKEQLIALKKKIQEDPHAGTKDSASINLSMTCESSFVSFN